MLNIYMLQLKKHYIYHFNTSGINQTAKNPQNYDFKSIKEYLEIEARKQMFDFSVKFSSGASLKHNGKINENNIWISRKTKFLNCS